MQSGKEWEAGGTLGVIQAQNWAQKHVSVPEMMAFPHSPDLLVGLLTIFPDVDVKCVCMLILYI